LRGGNPLWTTIQRGIETSSAYAVVVSADGLQSKRLGKELLQALEVQKQRGNEEFPVIPLSLNGAKLGAMEGYFGGEPIYIDVRTDANGIEEAVNAILVAMRKGESAVAQRDAFRVAESMVEEAERSNAITLDLHGLGLSSLPELLRDQKQLQGLMLDGNQLNALPEWLGELRRLQTLLLTNNQLTALPECLGELRRLRALVVTFNRLTALPKSLGKLDQLETLFLDGNRLSEWPEWLGRLTRIQTIDISDNQLSVLPDSLGRLTQLRSLNLSRNQLTALPDSFDGLKELQSMFVSSNRLTSLPNSMAQLTNLQELHLHNNRLATLPDGLRELAARGSLATVYLHGNGALGLPDDVLGREFVSSSSGPAKPAKEILDYYFATRGREGAVLGELRLIVVGRPKVGKTSLIKRLRGLPMDAHEAETHGIDIQPLDLECRDGRLHARVWDFGGQHVLHAMHEFFLRSRCLYLLVVEQRSSDVERDLTYWLQLIRSYAGKAPVVVALNQSKGVLRSLARSALEREYGPIVAWVPTDCAPEKQVPGANATIESLRQALADAANAMPEPKRLFPRKWLAIKRWLEEMKEPYLEYSVYARRCAELEERDPEQQAALAAAMDELGVALNYGRDPRLRDTTVLRPNWLANGIYTLLRANILTPKALVPDGTLTEEKVGEVLGVAGKLHVLNPAEYPRDKWRFLLRLMNLFQLSFPVDEKGHQYLVPTLLPADEPHEIEQVNGANVVKLRYEFDVVPGPLMGRLIVRLFALIDGRKAWQRGARLRYGDARGFVCVDLGETYVYATVGGGGPDRGELLDMIRESLKEMFREYERLRVVEQWWHDNEWVPRGTLEKFGVLRREADSNGTASTREEGAP